MCPDTHPSVSTRARIQSVSERLYMRGGYEGFSFGDIAAELGITRANIHYHFGSKQELMATLIDGFVHDALIRLARHWTTPGDGFADRLQAQCRDLKAFYAHHNPEPGQRNVWSPISRLRLDLPVLGEQAIAALDRVNHGYDACLRHAVSDAAAARELRPGAPTDDIVRLLRTTIMSCGPMTQDHGNFAEVERLFATIGRTIATAWGTARLRRVLA